MKETFTRNLTTALKKIIKGKVHCCIVKDTLVVDIESTHRTGWKYILPNLSSEIVQGFTSKKCAEIIVKQYTTYIRNLYFL